MMTRVTEAEEGRHSWTFVSGAVAICYKCHTLRRTLGSDGRFITEYAVVDKEGAMTVRGKAQLCEGAKND